MQPAPTTTAQAGKRRRGHLSHQPPQVAEIAAALLRLKTASEISGLSVPTLYRRAADDPTFPKLVRLGSRCTRIPAGPFMAWLAAKAEA